MIKTGVIGVGIMGQNHVRIYSEMGILNGIYDIDKNKADVIARKFNTTSFDTVEKLFNSDIQAVTVATPTITHFDYAVKAVEANKHILIEKPLDINYKRAIQIKNLLDKTDLILAVGHIERHNPGVEYLKNAIIKEEFGDVINISARRVSSLPSRIKDVGVILDLGIHDLDIISYLANSEILEIFCVGGSSHISNRKHEDHVIIILKFKNSITGIVETNWLTPMKVRKLSLTCSEKFVELDYIKQKIDISSFSLLQFEEANQFSIPYQLNVQQINLKKQEPLKREILDFLQAITKKRQPLVNGIEGVKAVKIADAARMSLHIEDKIRFDNFNGFD